MNAHLLLCGGKQRFTFVGQRAVEHAVEQVVENRADARPFCAEGQQVVAVDEQIV